MKEHAYSIDLVLPPDEALSLYHRMLQLLNENMYYEGSFQQQKMKCSVLTVKEEGNLPQSKGGKTENRFWDSSHPYLHNTTLPTLVAYSTSGITLTLTLSMKLE